MEEDEGVCDRAPDGVNQKLGWAVMVEQEEEVCDRALDIGQPDLDKQTDKKCT
ncbi:hypothetical protein MC7420_49 [Coleofasciculus chthonoplastes PCC 7420]|uniref:Uncharacterized protein n=1 Tax=Coleofasciculus chthonoplastes PCC 7420 TaxID=118168 RepID=B4W2Q9_9CYAN|nr:hypothetical protein [Coleofasciculus chthonoplastes]EDX70681.1 hypothetical protein MC7420_5309 [Coleofasciculus chthonoplastes PCC 7420]EDX71245.1 hypothetical protein MC7420_2806 [Coleofasciculus chthonoplastes PCC 7420]EDX71483.1 hypothetical protein MC7420_49 [Coleofasciculus chthonoplastes PCC 7420]